MAAERKSDFWMWHGDEGVGVLLACFCGLLNLSWENGFSTGISQGESDPEKSQVTWALLGPHQSFNINYLEPKDPDSFEKHLLPSFGLISLSFPFLSKVASFVSPTFPQLSIICSHVQECAHLHPMRRKWEAYTELFTSQTPQQENKTEEEQRTHHDHLIQLLIDSPTLINTRNSLWRENGYCASQWWRFQSIAEALLPCKLGSRGCSTLWREA